MMPLFPSPSLTFRTVGFPQSGFKAGISAAAFPVPWFAIALRALCCHRFTPALCQGRCAYKHLRASGSTALPQGPSLRSGLCCPGPSSLTWPHPPHSRAHLGFTDSRLIPDAFAVPISIGLGDPRLVPCFCCCSFSACHPLRPRGVHRLLVLSSSPMMIAFAVS